MKNYKSENKTNNKNKSNKNGRLVIYTAIITALLLIVSGCQSQPTSTDNNDNERAFPVEVETVGSGTIAAGKVVVGEISASTEVDIIAKVNARVESVVVNKGDYVAAGDVLAILEATDYLNNVRQAEVGLESAIANLENVKANYDFNITQSKQNVENAKLALENAKIGKDNAEAAFKDATINLERMTALYQADAIAKKDLEQVEMGYNQAKAAVEQSNIAIKQAQTGIETAEKALVQANRTESIRVTEAQVEQARLSYELAQQQLNNTKIIALISGEVTHINQKIGDMASPQMPFAKIVQTKPLIVKAKLSEEALKDFNKGDTVTVTVKTANEQANGKITYISTITDQQSKAYAMEIELITDNDILRPGMIAEIAAGNTRQTEAILAPTKAVILDGTEYFVYVVENNRAVKRQVEIGQENNLFIEIKSGLTIGEQVIVKGHMTISEGVLIQTVGGQ